jgi:hypothetical protein
MKNIIVTFDGQVVNGVNVSFVSRGKDHRSDDYQSESFTQLSWIRTDKMIESANDKENQDNPFFDYTEISIKSTDGDWFTLEYKDGNGQMIYRELIPRKNIVDVEIL